MDQNTMYLISAVLGQVMPVFIDSVNKHIASGKIRFLMSLFLSGVVGVLLNYNHLNFSGFNADLTTILLLWGSAQTAYHLYYDGSSVQNSIRFTKAL